MEPLDEFDKNLLRDFCAENRSSSMGQKATPKSCSCDQCKPGKRTAPGKQKLRHAERAFRHGAKQELGQGREEVLPSPKSGRIS